MIDMDENEMGSEAEAETRRQERARSIEDSHKTARHQDVERHLRRNGFAIEEPNERYGNALYRRISDADGRHWDIAIKTDHAMADTGNVFIETWSVWKDGKGKAGWAKDNRFDAIILYSPQNAYFWWLSRRLLQSNVDRWVSAYGTHEVANKGWTTLGVAVPESEIRRAASDRARQTVDQDD